MGALFGTRRADDTSEAYPVDGFEDKPKIDPRERLRIGLRPEANPRAF